MKTVILIFYCVLCCSLITAMTKSVCKYPNQIFFRNRPVGVVVESLEKTKDYNGKIYNPKGNSSCVIEVFNVISRNQGEQSNHFYIRGLECCAENTLEIYNRWGTLIFERKNYNNADRPFTGESEAENTVLKNSELPVGVYFYTLKYKETKEGVEMEKSGYLYINR